MLINEVLEGKNILIWGYGREGKSSENYIKNHCKKAHVEVFEGDRADIDESKYDLILKSPGIVMFDENPKYTSQTELFLNQFRDQTIGITGTKGKSTTSSLIYNGILAAGKKTVLLGNIGKPCFDCVDDIDNDTYVVFELSCHQLLHITEAPHIALFLNLFEEHLDYYKTFDKYFEAKANIIKHQKAGDFCLTGENVPAIQSESDRIVLSAPGRDYELQVLGEHNKLNAEFAYYVCVFLLGLQADKVLSGLQNFKGLPHRLEYFTEIDGTKFFDDSISTIPEAAVNASESVGSAGVMLIGGMDRGIDYQLIEQFIKTRTDTKFILMYDTGARIYRELGNEIMTNVYLVTDLKAAVDKAFEIKEKGKAVVLSPAAASYGFFKNFEERGDRFKELVLAHK